MIIYQTNYSIYPFILQKIKRLNPLSDIKRDQKSKNKEK